MIIFFLFVVFLVIIQKTSGNLTNHSHREVYNANH